MDVEAKTRILLVEDDSDSRCALTMLFELEGFEVITADNGWVAYLKAQAEQFDVIVTDINMPNTSGLDLIGLIRGDKSLASMPIVAVSAVDKRCLNRAKELGATAVCQKPIEFDHFISLIAKITSARRVSAATINFKGDAKKAMTHRR